MQCMVHHLPLRVLAAQKLLRLLLLHSVFFYSFFGTACRRQRSRETGNNKQARKEEEYCWATSAEAHRQQVY